VYILGYNLANISPPGTPVGGWVASCLGQRLAVIDLAPFQNRIGNRFFFDVINGCYIEFCRIKKRNYKKITNKKRTKTF
jgi:hypothetical protein